MKKISLLKSLAILGAVALTSVCVIETALLLHKNISPENSDLINLNSYNGYTLTGTLDGTVTPNSDMFKVLLKEKGIKSVPSADSIHPIQDILDIDIIVDAENKQFTVSPILNSKSYVAGTSATISYAFETPVNLSSILGN
jgi:hypothetical protein